jgi:undecaprenyl diphosphate synthase
MSRVVSAVPQHVAIIMDGNGRWARRRGLPRTMGHRASVKVVRKTVEDCSQRGVRYLSLFAFSSENFQRPAEEVGVLMGLFLDALDREVAELHGNGVRLRFTGERATLAAELIARMSAAEQLTAANRRLDLIVAVAYGGRWDIVQACRRLAAQAASAELVPDSIDSQRFSAALDLPDVPDVDLLIRTGGEQRISNFMLWKLAYAELFFTSVEWPDFSAADLDAAISFYAERERRFGLTSAQVRTRPDA